MKHTYGKSIQILEFADNNEFIVNDVTLKQMLEHPDVKNRKIAAFSIIGAFRRGKSFFLDYCLRFLYANYASINQPDVKKLNPNNWMGDKNEPLKGFSWRSGSARDTTGIMIWNDVFLHTDEKSGDKIAIIVIDTQGLFDNETTTIDNSRVFALGTLISSIQVLNLSNVIQEDQLQYLQFATEFAKFAASNDEEEESSKPFQNLLFLIRDWQHPNDFKYGIEGGRKYLDNILKIKQNQNEELKSVRQFVNNSFEKLDCALLPHPGDKVAVDEGETDRYDGHWGGMKENFKDILEDLIENLLAPEKLKLKRISGNELKGIAFKEYIMQYFNLFQSEQLPKTKSIYEATIEKHMEMFTTECIDDYKNALVERQNLITTIEQIAVFHDMSKYKALSQFNESKKMGSKSHANRFKETLENEINKYYAEWSDKITTKITRENEDKERVQLAQKEEIRAKFEKLESKLTDAEEKAKIEMEKLTKEFEYKETLQQKEIHEFKLKADQEHKLRVESEKHSDEKLKLNNEQCETKLIEAKKQAKIEKENLMNEFDFKLALKQKEVDAEKSKFEQEQKLKSEAEKHKDEKQILIVEQLEEKLSETEHQAKLMKQNAEKEKVEMKSKHELEMQKMKKEIEHQVGLKQNEIERLEASVDFERMHRDVAAKHQYEMQETKELQFEEKLSETKQNAEKERKNLRDKFENQVSLKQKEIDRLEASEKEFKIEIENIRKANLEQKVECKFKTLDWLIKDDVYTCCIQTKVISQYARFNFLGSHEDGKTNDDVKGIRFWDCTISKVPQGLTNFFPNLKFLSIYKSQLKSVQQEDLREYKDFINIGLPASEIRSLPGDLFAGMRNLESIWFNGNKIKYIGSNLLDGLNKLKVVNFRRNPSIDLCFGSAEHTKNDGNATLEEIKKKIREMS